MRIARQTSLDDISERSDSSPVDLTFDDPVLPPVDGGRRAWTVLFAVVILEALLRGIPSALAVCFLPPLNYGSDVGDVVVVGGADSGNDSFRFRFDSTGTGVTARLGLDRVDPRAVGILAARLPDLGAPLTALVVAKYPRARRTLAWAGGAVILASLLLASFLVPASSSDSAPSRVLFLPAVLYGLGALTALIPLTSILNEWWLGHLGKIYGLVSASPSVLGLPLPFFAAVVLDRFGARWALRGLALVFVVLAIPALFFAVGRLPPPSMSKTRRPPVIVAKSNNPEKSGRSKHVASASAAVAIDYTFVKRPLFWFLSVSNIAHCLAWPSTSPFPLPIPLPLPLALLPSFAADLGIPMQQRSLLIALSAVSAGVVSPLLLGALSDSPSTHVANLAALSSVSASAAALFFWGFARHVSFLAGFALIVPTAASGWDALWGRFAAQVSNHQGAVVMAFALFSCQRGIADLAAGSAASSLLFGEPQAVREWEYGIGRYSRLVLFTGGMLAFSGMVCFSWFVIVPKHVRWRSETLVGIR